MSSLPHLVTRSRLLDSVSGAFVTSGQLPSEELRRRLAADAWRLGPGLEAAIEALAVAGRSPRAFSRRGVAYDGPVTAVWGDRDALVPPGHIRGVIAALPQATVHRWPGMGHHPQHDRPAALTALVRSAHRAGGGKQAFRRRATARLSSAHDARRREHRPVAQSPVIVAFGRPGGIRRTISGS